MKAQRINEFTPDGLHTVEGNTWLSVKLTAGEDYSEYKALPEVAQYNGKRFYKMSFNSDSHLAHYKESNGKPYHLRYA